MTFSLPKMKVAISANVCKPFLQDICIILPMSISNGRFYPYATAEWMEHFQAAERV